jgi:hypothetical protein
MNCILGYQQSCKLVIGSAYEPDKYGRRDHVPKERTFLKQTRKERWVALSSLVQKVRIVQGRCDPYVVPSISGTEQQRKERPGAAPSQI